jgi:phage-related protein
MTDTFNWRVHSTASGSGEFTTAKAQFGDGYAQEVPLGLNNEVQKWTITVSDWSAELEAGPLAFLRAHAGMSFFWTPPAGVPGYYKCKRYQLADQGRGYLTLNAEFEQAFMP